MAFEGPVTRRDFLKMMGGSVITVTTSSIPVFMSGCAPTPSREHITSGSPARESTAESLSSAYDWGPDPGTARWRIDGLSKVTGSRIYARDFKARDFNGWPKQ